MPNQVVSTYSAIRVSPESQSGRPRIELERGMKMPSKLVYKREEHLLNSVAFS